MDIKTEIKEEAILPDSFTEDLDELKANIAGPFSDDCSSLAGRNGCNLMKMDSDSCQMNFKTEIKYEDPLQEPFTENIERVFITDIQAPFSDDCSLQAGGNDCDLMKMNIKTEIKDEDPLQEHEFITDTAPLPSSRNHKITAPVYSSQEEEHLPYKEIVIRDGNFTSVQSVRLTSEKVCQDGNGSCSSLPQSNLGEHSQIKEVIKVASADIRPYKCDICKKSFECESDLSLHSLFHPDVRQYICDICKKCFKWKSHLKQHILLHSDIRPYKCDVCEKRFKDKFNLDRHVVLHSNARPYKCNMCDKCFKWKSSLDRHVLLHSDSKPYKCDRCEKHFKWKSSLDQHLLLHSDSNPFKCNKCEKSFKWKTSLDQHVLLHSDSKPYKCNKCEKCFNNKSNLSRHALLHSDTRASK